MPDQKSVFPVADIIVVCRVAWRHSAPGQVVLLWRQEELYLLTPVCCLLLPTSNQEQVPGSFHHMSDLIIQKLYPQDTVKISSEAWQEFNHFTTCECFEPIQLNWAASWTTYLWRGVESGWESGEVVGVGEVLDPTRGRAPARVVDNGRYLVMFIFHI